MIEIIKFNEDFFDWIQTKKSPEYTFEILRNPTRSEIRGLDGHVRFLADADTEEFFVWDSELLHRDAIKRSAKIDDKYMAYNDALWKYRDGIVGIEAINPRVIFGLGVTEKGKDEIQPLRMDSVDQFDKPIMRLFSADDWGWSEKYAPVPWFIDYKKRDAHVLD